MAKIKGTRWYQSLIIRLLALFWLLLLGAAVAVLSLAFYFTKPPAPEALADDFQRTLPPVFMTAQSSGLLQPGRLLVGEYRVLARLDDADLEPSFAPALHPDFIHYITKLLEQPEAQQVAVGDKMLAGPFATDNALLIITRPLTAAEVEQITARGEQDWLPRVFWLSVGFSGFGAFVLGLWFVRPLRKLRNATREMASGVAEPNLGRLPKRGDEVGELARTLAVTALELATSRDAQRRLLSDVSHELRSPLARSQVALDLLGDETATIRSTPHYRQIEKDIYRLGTIIDSILWLSRLENGLDEPVWEQVDVLALCEEIKADLSYAQDHWGQRLVLPENDIPQVKTDPVLLRLVLENLIRNAFQYGGEEGFVFVTLDIPHQAASSKKQPASLIITVRDEGTGVDASKLEQLFEPFFRADPSRHHRAGVGLGLALCQRASRVLGGELQAENHIEGGLQVKLILPL